VSAPTPDELAALLGPQGVAYLVARCRGQLAEARRCGVTRGQLRPSLRATVEFVEQVLAAAASAPIPADSLGDPSEWVSITQAAEIAEVDSRAVRHAVQRGHLAYRRRVRGKGYEVRRDLLAMWIERRTPPYGQPQRRSPEWLATPAQPDR
jgi:hypothetical protein